MISAQNRQLQLNGSKFILLFLLVVLLSGCGIFSSKKTSNPGKNSNTKIDNKPEKVDTILWKQVPESQRPPIKSETEVISTKPDIDNKPNKRNSYRIAAFIPLESNKIFAGVETVEDLNNINYINYYAGMKLALEQLDREGVSLTLDVYDSKENPEVVKDIVQYQLASDVDLIFAPLKKEILSYLAAYGKEKRVPVISPWLTSRSVTNGNPFYIQLRPYLIDHYKKITEHALNEFEADQIYLLSRNDNDTKRFRYFQEQAELITRKKNALQTMTFAEGDLNGEFEIFRNKIIPGKKTVFIIPNYSSKDESFIYNTIRRINVERGPNEVVIYGMPLLFTMDKMNFDFYNNLNMRIVMSRFVNREEVSSKDFVSNYFRVYNDFPTDDAFEGYDNMLYIGRQLSENGRNFYMSPQDVKDDYFSAEFLIEPVYTNRNDADKNVRYYENKGLRIIEYKGDHFEKSN